ncbi:MAG TPA: Hsp20/alpha crystallin family protein [bacterium]|jgi:hypothetical protein
MAVLVLVDVPGVKKQDYENLRKEVRWEDNPPKGAMIHVAGVDESGVMHVSDVWTSEEDFNNFVTTRLMPGFRKFNLPQPVAKIYQVHNANVFDLIDQLKPAPMTR